MAVCCLCAVPCAARQASVHIAAGELHEHLAELTDVDELTLTGRMDVRDFNTLQDNLYNLKSLDLQGVEITPYIYREPMTGEMRSYEADRLPEGALLAFELEELRLPATLRHIGCGALIFNKFTTLSLPATLLSIGEGAFKDCDKLTHIELPAGVRDVGIMTFTGCTALQSVDMSATSVTALPERMFSNTPALKSIKLPAALQGIGEYVFCGSGIETLSVPASVASIGDFAFSECRQLKSVSLADGSAQLGRGLFFACPEFVTFHAEGIERFPDYLFAADPLYDASPLTPSLKHIGDYALKDTGAATLTFGSTLVYLGDGALENMQTLHTLDVIALEGNVPELGSEVFAGIDQPSVTLITADAHREPWKSADQWREFKVLGVSDTGIDGTATDTPSVTCRFAGTMLIFESTLPMRQVDVYDPSGAKVASAAPGDTYAQIQTEHLAARVYIVRVASDNDNITTFKLIR